MAASASAGAGAVASDGRLKAEEIVLAMLSDDDYDRPDVVTALSTLRSVYTATPVGGRLPDGVAAFVPAVEAQELLLRQRAAMRSLALWRSRDNRARTTVVGLMLCLNIGTEPPDVPRVAPYARLESWIDTSTSDHPGKTLQAIGDALLGQYERWQTQRISGDAFDQACVIETAEGGPCASRASRAAATPPLARSAAPSCTRRPSPLAPPPWQPRLPRPTMDGVREVGRGPLRSSGARAARRHPLAVCMPAVATLLPLFPLAPVPLHRRLPCAAMSPTRCTQGHRAASSRSRCTSRYCSGISCSAAMAKAASRTRSSRSG